MEILSPSRRIGLLLGPTLFLFLLVAPSPEGLSPLAQRMAAVVVLMAVFWITEAVPIAVTALLPLALYPLLGIAASKQTALAYGNHLLFLFIGGCLIAAGLQKWNLHRRIALSIILWIGADLKRIMMGFMLATAFLSMWISNTATTLMMWPVALAVVVELAQSDAQGRIERSFGTVLMLAIAYSASVGGMSTLIGTGTNVAFAALIRELFPDSPEIGFTTWMALALPLTAVFLPIIWLVLLRYAAYLGLGQIEIPVEAARRVVSDKLAELGRPSRGEKTIAVAFFMTVFLWVFRKPIPVGDLFTLPGWSQLFPVAHAKYLHDTTAAVLMAVLLFMIPVDFKKGIFAMDWKTGVRGVPWDIVLLMGGGFALATGFKATGLDVWLAGHLGILRDAPTWLMILAICALMTFVTEFTSNIASTTIMIPILAALAQSMQVHPLLLIVPATLSASCAFMMPVATPPNAIVFSSGWIDIRQMAQVGIVLNVLGILLVTAMSYAGLYFVLGIDPEVFPAWAASSASGQ